MTVFTRILNWSFAIGLACGAVFFLGANTSRDDYKAFVQQVYPGISRPALQNVETAQKYGAEAARREAIVHQLENTGGTSQYVTNTLNLLRAQSKYLDSARPKSVNTEQAIDATEAYIRIRSSPTLTAADHQFAKNLILTYENLAPPRPLEYGAMNRAMDDATQRRLILLLFPHAAPTTVPSGNGACADDRTCYTQRVWNDWAAFSDTYENSMDYNGVWWGALMKWIRADEEFKVRDARSVLEQPSVKTLVYRYLAQASPLGLMPAYGDTGGLNADPGVWIRLMEDWATIFRDGEFKWVAHRMFEWTSPQKTEMGQWGTIIQTMMDQLMAASIESDSSISERMPTIKSTVTYRHAMDFRSGLGTSESAYPILKPNSIPDKLILRSGWNPDDLYALVDLAPFMGHGHEDAGSIDLMTSNGSVLLGDTSYLVKDHRFHNAFILDVDGFTIPNKQYPNLDRYLTDVVSKEAISVPRFVDGKLGSYAQVVISPYVGQPATLNRSFLLVKNRFLWVKDVIHANQPFQATVGPAWQTGSVDRNASANSVNTRMSRIPIVDVFNLKYLMQWTNKPWDLLVLFPQDGEASIKIDDVSRDTTHGVVKQDVQNAMNYRIWDQTHVALPANGEAEFNSVLFPHAPAQDAKGLAARFKLLINSKNQTVLRFEDPSGDMWYAGINDSHLPLEFDTVKTDMQTFVLRMHAGKIEEQWQNGGKYLQTTH